VEGRQAFPPNQVNEVDEQLLMNLVQSGLGTLPKKDYIYFHAVKQHNYLIVVLPIYLHERCSCSIALKKNKIQKTFSTKKI